MSQSALTLVAMSGWAVLTAGVVASYRFDWGIFSKLVLIWAAIAVGIYIVLRVTGLDLGFG